MAKAKLTKKEIAEKLGVSVSSLYYKAKKPVEDLEVKAQIEAVLTENPTYGHKRLALALKLNKKRILRVMKKFNIKPYKRRSKNPKKPEDYKKPETKFKNLIENICPVKPNFIWVTDFTYIKYQGKFFYLATLMDLYTREIVGFNISRYHNQELVTGAIEDALSKHKRPEILHSDQGSEYDSKAYENICNQLGIKISMSRKSSPWENGFQESFYSHFKLELADQNRFEEYGQLLEEIYRILNYYNTKRIHTALKISPKQFKEKYFTNLNIINSQKILI